jgi:hypothetical protein
MQIKSIFLLLFLIFSGGFLSGEDVKDSALVESPQVYSLLVLGKFREARKISSDSDLNKALDSLFTLNEKAAKTYEKYIGKNITLDVKGLPLTGVLTKIKGSSLYMKLKRGKGSVVMPVSMNSIPLNERIQKVDLPELAKNICMGAKFFRQKNYQGAQIFFSKTGKFSQGLENVLLIKSKYFIPFFAACKSGSIEEIEKLLKLGADVNSSCSAMIQDPKTKKYVLQRSTILIETIKCRQADVAKFLVNHGADVNKQNSQGVTPLMFSVMAFDNTDLLEFLLKHKAKLAHKDMAGNTPLSGAVAMAKVDAVKVLLENGADPDEATSKGFTPVMIAVLANRPAILKILLNAGADINKPHPKGWTVFQLDRSRMAPEIRSTLSRLAPEKPKKKKQRTSFPGVDIIR